MKADKLHTCVFCAGLSLLLGFVPSSPGQSPAPSVRHRFLAVDDATHTLVNVDQTDPSRDWSVPTGFVMDMQLLGTNRVLLNVDAGFREYDLASGKLVRSVDGAGGRSFSVYRTPDERTILTGDNLGGQKGASVVAYDRAGALLECKAFPNFSMLRHIRPTPDGTWLVTAVGQILELDEHWNLQRRTPLPGNLFKAVRLANGNILCSSGPGARWLKELNRQAAVVREIRGDALKEGSFTGFQLLPTGGVVVANWLGHGPDHDGTVLVEFDPEGRLLWRYNRPRASFVEVIVRE